MKSHTRDIDKRFDEKVKELSEKPIGDICEFGYKIQTPDPDAKYIWTVPDWFNIKKFIHSEIEAKVKTIREEIEKMPLTASDGYNYAIKEILSLPSLNINSDE